MENAVSPETPSPRLASLTPKPVDVAAIEEELAKLWRYQQEAGSKDPVTRACMSNLVVFCSAQDQANVVAGEITSIVTRHPSRVLLLVGDSNSQTPSVEAYVSAHCHLFGEGQQQVCSEHVTINTSGSATRLLPSAVRSLLIGDLPTALWWAAPQAPPLGGELFQELRAMADQVIYDSLGWPDAVRSMVATANWVMGERTRQVVSDLAWRRMKPWRRLVSQSLDPALAPGALESVSEVVVEHGPHALPQAWLLIGWLACRLGWRPVAEKVAPGVEVTWGFQSPHGPLRTTVRRLSEGEPEVRSVWITWERDGRPASVRFAVVGPGRLGVTTEGAQAPWRVLVAPPQPRATLVARQLPVLGRDTLFREIVDVAGTMAEALLR